jgi:hypothetical protein
MKHTREQLRAGLLAEAVEVIDELLDWHEATETPTLSEIEEVVLKLRKRLGERMAETVIEDQDAVRPVPGPGCPECSREMHYKGMKKVTVEGRTGQVQLRRAYYYCDRCRRGLFPPGPTTTTQGEALE